MGAQVITNAACCQNPGGILMKIEEMTDVFLNSDNFAPHVLLTFVPPSSFALNLKALIKVLKVS